MVVFMKFIFKIAPIVFASLAIGFYSHDFLPEFNFSFAKTETAVESNHPRKLTEIHATNHLHIIKADQLHKQGHLGEKSQVYIVDLGADLHAAPYQNNYTQACINRFTNQTDALLKLDSKDEEDHGIIVTSVAVGEYGVAPKAALEVFNLSRNHNGESFNGQLLQSLLEIASDPKKGVVNLSLDLETRGPLPDLVKKTLTAVANSGKVIVIAAGNQYCNIADSENELVKLALSPEMKGCMIFVGASDYPSLQDWEDEKISSFSNKAGDHSQIFITAPGSDIPGCGHKGLTISAGTSFSAPQVTGAIALLMDAFPHLEVQEYVKLILESARKEKLPPSAKNQRFDAKIFGQGLLDVHAAYQLAQQKFGLQNRDPVAQAPHPSLHPELLQYLDNNIYTELALLQEAVKYEQKEGCKFRLAQLYQGMAIWHYRGNNPKEAMCSLDRALKNLPAKDNHCKRLVCKLAKVLCLMKTDPKAGNRLFKQMSSEFASVKKKYAKRLLPENQQTDFHLDWLLMGAHFYMAHIYYLQNPEDKRVKELLDDMAKLAKKCLIFQGYPFWDRSKRDVNFLFGHFSAEELKQGSQLINNLKFQGKYCPKQPRS